MERDVTGAQVVRVVMETGIVDTQVVRVVELWGDKERHAVETDRVYFTLHNAHELKKKWDSGLRRWHPKRYEIDERED